MEKMAMSYVDHRVNVKYERARAEIGPDELALLFHAHAREKSVALDVFERRPWQDQLLARSTAATYQCLCRSA
jgi:hypothetical protein